MIIATLEFMAVESYLIRRDKANGKGATGIDRKTRNYNAILLDAGMSGAIITYWIKYFRFSSSGTSIFLWIGVLILCLGLLLRYWSIHVLGKNFRTTIELEKGQKVIQRGPYKWIRHPSYSGIILFCIGYGLIAQNWLSLIIVVSLPTIALLYRIKIEEEELTKGMGDEYKEYKKKTKKLIPGIW
ncbi:MAG: isoprenylcysteine carboxylmethyltransferase family protein [Bacteroidia bacterium]|nr:isoprenylcysteine carboxylmethyltransferase family protein [Bacteroidia bacterium]